MQTGGLSLDQAPRLSIPAIFFLTIPIAVLAAGCILIASGVVALSTPWAPQTLALAHAGTLGVLAMAMAGALYQMTPVIAGTPVPFTPLACCRWAGRWPAPLRKTKPCRACDWRWSAWLLSL